MSRQGLDTRFVRTGPLNRAAQTAYASKINNSRCANSDGPLYVSPRDGYRVWHWCMVCPGSRCAVKEA